jgi:hypothetical protein
VIVNGCKEDGSQFYGEKCGGSSFTAAPDDVTYGVCGKGTQTCGCKLYTTSSAPGCYAIASPVPDQNAVFAKFEGCTSAGSTSGSTTGTEVDGASHLQAFALPSLLVLASAFALV